MLLSTVIKRVRDEVQVARQCRQVCEVPEVGVGKAGGLCGVAHGSVVW